LGLRIIDVANVKKIFKIGPKKEITVADGLSFQVARGEVICIVGKTGCGKSTCFNMLLGLEPVTEGRILIEERDPYRDFKHLRTKIGAVFQTDRLLPWRTALENAVIGLEIVEKSKGIREEMGGYCSRLCCEPGHSLGR
jgi:NitT/TauT family transport system ATP-binding protein